MPTNISFSTATDLAPLPASFSQSADDGVNPVTVYFKYTPPADGFIGFWAFGNLVTYRPRLTVYEADQVTQYLDFNGTITNLPVQMPVFSGQTLYFEVAKTFGDAPPCTLAI